MLVARQEFEKKLASNWYLITSLSLNHLLTLFSGFRQFHVSKHLSKYKRLLNLQGARISMGRQLKNHKIIISRIVDILGKKSLAQKHLNKCLYSVGMGSNDYINNYFVPQYYHTSKKFTTEQYAEVLINQYSWEILVISNC